MAAVLVVGCSLGGLAWGVRSYDLDGEERRRAACRAKLKILGLALEAYAEANGSLPPAVTNGPDGKPWHSWRVLAIPLQNAPLLNGRYRLDEPWDGPNNRRLHGLRFSTFECPNCLTHPTSRLTSYVAVTGPGTAFPGPDETVRPDRIDGSTILAIESASLAPHWMEPRDPGPSDLDSHLGPRSGHGGVVQVLFADGTVTALPPAVVRERIRAMHRAGSIRPPGSDP